MAEDFANWLNRERSHRNLSLRGLARLAGLSPPTITLAANEGRASADTCAALARVFGVQVEDVLRLAGIMPPATPPARRVVALCDRISRLPDLQRQEVERLLEIALTLAETQIQLKTTTPESRP